MSTKPKAKLGKQAQNFIEKARELGCDEDEAAFEKRLKKIVKAPAEPRPKPKRLARKD